MPGLGHRHDVTSTVFFWSKQSQSFPRFKRRGPRNFLTMREVIKNFQSSFIYTYVGNFSSEGFKK